MTGARFFAKEAERRRDRALAERRANGGNAPAHRCDACGRRVESMLEAINGCAACSSRACACGGVGCDACEGSL